MILFPIMLTGQLAEKAGVENFDACIIHANQEEGEYLHGKEIQ